MELFKTLIKFSIAPMLVAAATLAQAAQLSTDARSAIPHDVQQLVVIDYRAMQNSTSAMALRQQVEPPELKEFEDALAKSGLNGNNDVDVLAFVLFRTSPANSTNLDTVGIAQGQFDTEDVIANFHKKKVKPQMVRQNSIWPMGRTGMVLCFVDPSTMIFGGTDAVKKALDARDGYAQSMLTNNPIMSAMQSVDSEDLWSILDSEGTQTMMRQVLGQAGGLTDFDSIKKRLQESYYSMDFAHGVHFNLTIVTGDTITAATMSSLLTAAILLRKTTGGTDAEKQALSDTSVSSNSGQLAINFAASDSEFRSLLESPLFKDMVHD
ncbi:MAG TPA: hypothetical protein VGS10_08590 [Terracidiphilus sp.]|nr:hypothetical protein [Terracidiphilus sp.]